MSEAHLTAVPAGLQMLRRMLDGDAVSVDDVLALASADDDESEYLEFKGAGWVAPTKGGRRRSVLGKPVDFPSKLRKWVSGFFNSLGGLLVLGVEERSEGESSRPVSGFNPSDIGSTEREGPGERLTRLLQPLLPRMAPPPVIRIVALGDTGRIVALIATARGSALVPCIEGNGQPDYYLRSHESTFRAPDYLIADLLLNRRARPVPSVENANSEFHQRRAGSLHMTLSLCLANDSLVWMDEVRYGWLAFHVGRDPSARIPSALIQRVRTMDYVSNAYLKHTPRRLQLQERPVSLAPFDSRAISLRCDAPSQGRPVAWRAALYVVSRGNAPDWFQVDVYLDRSGKYVVDIERIVGQPPVVAVHEQYHTGWSPPLDFWSGSTGGARNGT